MLTGVSIYLMVGLCFVLCIWLLERPGPIDLPRVVVGALVLTIFWFPLVVGCVWSVWRDRRR